MLLPLMSQVGAPGSQTPDALQTLVVDPVNWYPALHAYTTLSPILVPVMEAITPLVGACGETQPGMGSCYNLK